MKVYWLAESITKDQRDAWVKAGVAMPDGSYPIPDVAYLKKAVKAFGRAKNKAAVKNWIIKRAKALKATDELPADWPGSTKAEASTEANRQAQANLNEAERSVQQINDLISQAARKEFSGDAEYPWDACSSWNIWVCDTYEDYVVISIAGTLYSFPWAIDSDGDITFGDATEVIPGYRAAADVTGDGDADGDDGVLALPGIPEALRKAKAGAELAEGMRPLYDALDAALTFAEAGRTLSKANEDKLRAAIKTMSDHVDSMSGKDDDNPTESGATDITGDLVPLLEKAIRRDGTVAVKVIQPGWGSSGYYSPELLERDGPSVFATGTKMYLDHPTPAEEAARPERSVRDLAGEFVSDARWEANGPAGAGLYADAVLLGPFKEVAEELAPHIGVSIRAYGKAKQGEAEGRKGTIIDQLTAAQSVDFVTVPGAGGQVLQLFESARGRSPEPGTTNIKEGQMTDDERREMQLLRETNARQGEELARIREGQTFVTATRYAKDVLTKRYGDVMPAKTIERLSESQGKRPTTKDDGAIDYEAFAAQIHEAAKDELAYLAEIGVGSGKVRGMGGSGPFETTQDLKESRDSLQDSFARMGLHKDAATLAAAGRN